MKAQCKLLWLALSLLLIAAQCSSAGVSTPDNTPPLPTPPAGQAVRIALLSPTTGEMATFGRMLRDGSIMAFDEWNTQYSGVLGQRLEWRVYDTPCDFEPARQATQQAVADGFHFLIGPLCSESAIAAALVAEENTALLMAPTATHPLVTVSGEGQTRPTVFRASFAWSLQGQAAARFAYENLKVRRVALFFDPRDDYSTTLTESFTQQFTQQGGEIVRRTPYGPGDTDLKPALQASQTAGAELLYLPAPVATVNRVNSQRRELGLAGRGGPIVLGSDSWESPELDLPAAEGAYFTVHFFLEDHRPETQRWADAYKATYATAPNTLATLGFDAATGVIAAIRQAKSVEVKKVAETLEQNHFDSVTGPITFDRHHNPLKPVPVVQVESGRVIFSTYVNGPSAK